MFQLILRWSIWNCQSNHELFVIFSSDVSQTDKKITFHTICWLGILIGCPQFCDVFVMAVTPCYWTPQITCDVNSNLKEKTNE